MSGVVVDLGRALTGDNALIAYGAVFALEAILLVIALGLLKRVDITRSVALAEMETTGQTESLETSKTQAQPTHA